MEETDAEGTTRRNWGDFGHTGSKAHTEERIFEIFGQMEEPSSRGQFMVDGDTNPEGRLLC